MKLLLLIMIALSAKSFAASFKLYPQGEKKFQSQAMLKPKMDLNLAQLESVFFIAEFEEGHNYSKHSPLFDLKLDPEAPFEVSLYWLLGHRTKNDFVEDIVIPVSQENIYSLPRENFPTKKLLLIELKGKLLSVPKSWTGDLTLVQLDNKNEFKIPVTAKLHRFALPSTFHLKTTFGFAPWTVVRKHNVTSNQEDNLYDQYFALAREHRIDLHKVYIEFSKQEDNLLSAAQNPIHSFMNVWNRAKGKDESYTRMQITDLPVPYEMKKKDSKSERFWRQLNKEAKNNNAFFVYFEDEPTPAQMSDMVPTLKSIKQWAPDLKLMMTAHWTKELDTLIDIWCPNLINWNVPPYPNQKKYAELKAKGDELWVYVSCNSHGCKKQETTGLPDLIIERPSSYLYSLPWVADALDAQGILYYDTVRGYLESEKAPWSDPKIFNGMGEGNLFYPCPKNTCGSTPVVFSSLRLKILRSALESLEIVKSATAKNKDLMKLKESAAKTPRFWAKKIADYEAVKTRALEIIDAN